MKRLRKIGGQSVTEMISSKLFMKFSNLLYILTRPKSTNMAPRNKARLGLEGPEQDEVMRAIRIIIFLSETENNGNFQDQYSVFARISWRLKAIQGIQDCDLRPSVLKNFHTSLTTKGLLRETQISLNDSLFEGVHHHVSNLKKHTVPQEPWMLMWNN